MGKQLSSDDVWKAIEVNNFGVLSWLSSKGQPRCAGISYAVADRAIYIHTGRDDWKARRIGANGAVAMTAQVPKSIPLLPIKIPPATITFRGRAELVEQSDVPLQIVDILLKPLTKEARAVPDVYIRVRPEGHFTTYGVGVSLMAMRDPNKARARVPV